MVSRHLAALEEWAGARLLHRSTRRLSLTGTGEQMLPQCRELCALAEAMQHLGRDSREAPRGRLRVTCSQSFAQAWLVHEIGRFQVHCPGVSVDLLVSSQAVNLIEERVDLALRITNQLDPNLVARKLATCRSVVCATPAYLARHGLPRSPEDLARHNCLTYSFFGRSLWAFFRDGEPCAVPVDGSLSANESMVLLEATLADQGISLQPRYSVAAHLRSGALVPCCRATSPRSWASTPSMAPAGRCPRPCACCSTTWPNACRTTPTGTCEPARPGLRYEWCRGRAFLWERIHPRKEPPGCTRPGPGACAGGFRRMAWSEAKPLERSGRLP